MSIPNANSFFLSPNQVNSAAANGAIQPGQMVLVPASMFESGQVDATQFQPVGNFDPSMYQGPDPFGVQPSGSYPYYAGSGQYQNPFNNGLPMGPGPVQTPTGSPILGGQNGPTLPGNTTAGQMSGTYQMLGQMVQMMISMLTQIMTMLQNAGTTAGDVTDNGNNNQGQNNNNNGGGCHGGGGQQAAQDVSASDTGTQSANGKQGAALNATGQDDTTQDAGQGGACQGKGSGADAAMDVSGSIQGSQKKSGGKPAFDATDASQGGGGCHGG